MRWHVMSDISYNNNQHYLDSFLSSITIRCRSELVPSFTEKFKHNVNSISSTEAFFLSTMASNTATFDTDFLTQYFNQFIP